MLSQDSEDEIRSRFVFGKMNSTLGSVVPLAMFTFRNNLTIYLSLLQIFLGLHNAIATEICSSTNNNMEVFQSGS